MLSWNRLFTRLLLLATIAFSGQACAGVTEYSLPKTEAVPSASFISGSTARIRIPLSALTDAKVASADGLVFRFADGSNFSMQVVTDASTGYPGVDMHSWPEYVLGLKNNGSEPKGYIEDLLKSHEQVIMSSIAPQEIRRFKTGKGIGYWALGESKSAIVLTDASINDQITIIFTQDMSESKILNIILNGVSQ